MVVSFTAESGNETRSSRAYANNITPGVFIQSQDDKFTGNVNWITNFTNYSNRAVVELGLDEEKHLIMGPFKVCAKFDVVVTDAALNSVTYTNQQLDINYNPYQLTRYKDKAQIVFPNAYKIKVTNIVITTCALNSNCNTCTTVTNASNIYLDAEISTDRIYDFNFTSSLNTGDLTHVYNGTNQELEINWAYVYGAEGYELEYTYVDDYVSLFGSSDVTYDFEHDATRISTTENTFKIPLIYEKGYIVYRVRPIGLSPTKQRIEGSWFGAPQTGLASSTAFAYQHLPFGGDIMNWTSVKTFAENGRSGIGVSFSDALGYNRQSLARLNTDSKTIAQSTLYDYYGRPTINILPAPVNGLNFDYRPSLNMYIPNNASPVPFDKSIFNTCTNTNNLCVSNAFTLDPVSSLGAANYYSPSNPNKQAYQGYLPDAEGLPYTQVKYKSDALDRVMNQSMPGSAHYLGSGKDIQYFYTQPMQVELDRLFGSEAGRSKYHFKNITIDPNGQTSATYIDKYGRTIATSLMGLNPLSVDALPNIAAAIPLTEYFHLIPTNSIDSVNRCKEVNSFFFVSSASTEDYLYQTTLGSFADTCNPGKCFDCVYDVEISIKDDCGTEIFDYDLLNSTAPGFTASIGKQPPYNSVICGSGPTNTVITGVVLNQPITIPFPKAGVYTVYKKICVSDKPLNDYTNEYLATNCKNNKCGIVDSILAMTDFSGCYPDTNCAACMASLETYTSNAANSPTMIVQGGPILPGTSNHQYTLTVQTPTLTPQQLSQALQNCEELCSPKTQCGKYTKALLADFYPGTGQYAATSPSDPNWNYSIFKLGNSLAGAPTWSTPPAPTNSYSNAAGNPDFVQINNINYPPQSLANANLFITNFKKSWAKSFLKNHPEACKLHFYCSVIGSSVDFDDGMKKITHYDTACVAGYLRPINYNAYTSFQPSLTCVNNQDPIVSLAFAFPGFATAINNFTTEITQNFNGSGLDIYYYTLAQTNSAVASSTVANGDFVGKYDCSADIEWHNFKDFYQTKKYALYQNLLATYTANPANFGFTGPGGCGYAPTGFQSHFPNWNDSIAAIFPNTPSFTTALNTPTNANQTAMSNYTTAMSNYTNAMQVNMNNTLTSQCAQSCDSYTVFWNNTLNSGCPAYANANQTVKNQIIAGLVGVCMKGCDYNTNLLGASTTPTNNPHILANTSVSVTSFQQVLNYYLGNNACNAIILSNPPPYPSATTNTASALTNCKCDQILQVEADFITLQNNNNLPAGITAPWQLFRKVYGYDLLEYNSLKCLCKATSNYNWVPGYVWTLPQLQSLAQNTMAVNPKLQCTSCLKCTDVVNAISTMSTQLLSNITYTSAIDAITLDSTNQIFAIAYLNNLFGPHPFQAYLDLYFDCQTFNSGPPTSLTFSNTITNEALDVYRYLDQLVSDKLLTTNSRKVKICTDSKFFLSSLYSGALPSVPNYTYYSNISGNVMTFTIMQTVNNAPVALVSFSLMYPISYTGNWNSFSYLNNFVAYCPVPVPGPNYGFKVNAIDNNFSVVTLTGSIVNQAYPICNLSSAPNPVPTLCPYKPKKKNTCAITLVNNALTQANQLAQQNLQNTIAQFQEAFMDTCFAHINETFTRTYNGADEYNFTLYYYDEGGNLQRTVPPKGVQLVNTNIPLLPNANIYPGHSNSAFGVNKQYVSDYRFFSYNQPISENTIDGGLTKYIYDETGRIILSQNQKQAGLGDVYSYTKYDNIGRAVEVGELKNNGTPIATLYPNSSFIEYNNAYLGLLGNALTTFSQVTKIFYDQLPITVSADAIAYFVANGPNELKNLRNRVACITFADNPGVAGTNYDFGTYYSYDDHGNVKTLYQENNTLPSNLSGNNITKEMKFKKVVYQYDLISGNMLEATYQPQFVDQLIHRYFYDADNRLHEVFTSKDNLNYDRDAKYFYYEHGPLARIERADKQVQGMDYLYTIHGWIKGINSDELVVKNDAGKDGAFSNAYLSSYNEVHAFFAKDAMAYSLNYYNVGSKKDYTSIKNANYNTNDVNPLASINNLYATSNFYLDNNGAGDGPSLYNGNISSMVTSFIDKNPANTITNNTPFPQLTAYRYDQLHRIKAMKSYRSLSGNAWNPVTALNYDDSYKMNLTYDPNGNIKTLIRNGVTSSIINGSNLLMDNLTYTYFESANPNGGIVTNNSYNSNKLACVQDGVPNANYSTDIDSYSVCAETNSRYTYDQIGNLTSDKGEYIQTIEWTVDRKVKKVIRNQAAMLATGTGPTSVTKPDVEYLYNGSRQRVVKIVKPRNQTTKAIEPQSKWIFTYYLHDASGNVMAVYDRTTSTLSGGGIKEAIDLGEHHIYGSDRLALSRPSNTLAQWSTSYTPCGGEGDQSTCRTFISINNPLSTITGTAPYKNERNLGFKEFELDNHLGNVIATVSDRKIVVTGCPNEFLINFNNGNPNNIVPVNTNTAIINNMLNVTPLSALSNIYLTYQVEPDQDYELSFDVDLGNYSREDTLTALVYKYNNATGQLSSDFAAYPISTSGNYNISFTAPPSGTGFDNIYLSWQSKTNPNISKNYFLDNIAMAKAAGPINTNPPCSLIVMQFKGYFPDLLMHDDYYAFGQTMPGRKWVGTAGGYRYSHNGHEKEDEIFAGAQSAEYWMYDSRLGRRWERDPVIKPWESPYATFGNNPIYYSDPLGLDKDGDGKKCADCGNSINGKKINSPKENKPKEPVDKLDMKPIVMELPTGTEPELRSASTGNVTANGQQSQSVSSNPDQTSEGYTIMKPFMPSSIWKGEMGIDGLHTWQEGFTKNPFPGRDYLRYVDWTAKWDWDVSMSAGPFGVNKDGQFSIQSGWASISKNSGELLIVGWDKSINTVANIVKPQGSGPLMSVISSTVLYDYVYDKSRLATFGSVNLKVYQKSVFVPGGIPTQGQLLIDTNYSNGFVTPSIPFGPASIQRK